MGENVFMAAEDFLPTSFALSGASSSSATSVLTFLAEAGTSTSFSDSRFTLLSGIAFAATNKRFLPPKDKIGGSLSSCFSRCFGLSSKWRSVGRRARPAHAMLAVTG